MKMTEVRYKIERTKKEFAYDINGATIYLKEVYNSKGQNIFCVARLVKQDKSVVEMHYSENTREQTMKELEELANGKTIKSINAITGKADFK